MKRATCYLADFTLEDCEPTTVTCKGGCDFADSKWDCKNQVYNCQYTLVCRPHAAVSKHILMFSITAYDQNQYKQTWGTVQ